TIRPNTLPIVVRIIFLALNQNRSSGITNGPELFVIQPQRLPNIIRPRLGCRSPWFFALFCGYLRALRPPKTGDEAGIEAGNQIAQGRQGVVILVEGNFRVGLTVLGGGIPVEFGFGQEIRTSRAVSPEPAGPQSSVDGGDAALNCIAAAKHF